MLLARFIIAALAILAPTLALAAPALHVLSAEQAAGISAADRSEQPKINVLDYRPDGLTLEFSLPAIVVDDVEGDGRMFQLISIPGGGDTGEIGQPLTPTFARLVSIPDGAAVRVNATVTEEDQLTGFHLVPVQADQGKAFAYDAAAYLRDQFDTTPAVAVGQPATLRDLRVVPLTVNPVRYNPAQGVLKIARTIRVDVSFQVAASKSERRRGARPIAPSFDALYRDLVVNYETPLTGVQPGTWVVICPNDPQVISRLQPLLTWHQRKGYPVRLATTAETGTSNTSIKNWIQNAYDTWENPPEYVSLAGDADAPYVIATWYENVSGYAGCGDHPYTQLDGGDVLSDIHIGRLSYSSLTELDIIVNKCVTYESAPYMASDPSWFTRACLVGDPAPSGLSCIQLQQWVKVRLRQIGYTEIDTVFSSNTGAIIAGLNRGNTIYSYRGIMGMSGVGVSNILTLTNGAKMPFAVAITCDTGTFAAGTCRTEAFLRAGSMNPVFTPRAAIGSIGTSTTGTHTRYNNCIQYGIFYGLLYRDLYTMGAALTRGKLEMYLNFETTDPNHVLIWSHWNNLMGDPAVECWTGYPTPLVVDHPASIPVGATAVSITVRDDGTAAPLAGAQVCLWKGNETYAVRYTDVYGQVELPVAATTAGDMLLTVTRHNRLPYTATIPVVGGSQFVGYASSTVDDDNAGGSSGNADGVVNPGETIGLRVQIRNFGTQAATDVNALLSTTDPYTTIGDATQGYGTIAAGAAAWSANPYVVTVDGGAPHGHTIRFGLNAQSGPNQWHSLVDLPVVSADLAATSTTLYNAGDNGILDPGETVQMSIRLLNQGGAGATGAVATLTSLSPNITIVDGDGSYGTIAAGAAAENSADTFSLSAGSETYPGHVASLRLVVDFSAGASDTCLVQVTVGQRASNDPTGPDQRGYYAFDNADADYPLAPIYSWIELDPSYGGSGTEVPLTDYGTYQDDSEVIPLPFPFTYYGANYTQATVCSNGWVAMGATYLTEYRNWTIPSAGGPQSMIAPFWDDLNLAGGGKVLSLYDAANHRFVIEWSRVHNEPGGAETFEAILYNPFYYPTDNGDGVILFQYNTVANNDAGDNYATVGIENIDHTDGLLYTFSSVYSSGATYLGPSRAIRFLPYMFIPRGTLQGTVRNQAEGANPIEGAEVSILQTGRILTTDPAGRFSGTVAAGTYTLVARHWSFAPDTTFDVAVAESQTTTCDFSLDDNRPPAIAGVTNSLRTTSATGPYPIEATITDLTGVASARLYYRLDGGGWTELPMTGAGDIYATAIPGHRVGTQIDYYVWARDAGGLPSTMPEDAPTGFYTLYVATLAYSYTVEDPVDSGWQLGAAGDNATGGAWVRVDPVGTTYGDPPVQYQPEDDHTPDPGVLCFVTGQGNPGFPAGQSDVDGGCTTLVSPMFDVSAVDQAFLTYDRWFAEGGPSADDEFAVDVSSDGGSTWIPLERVPSSDNTWREITKNLGDSITLTDQVMVRFVACDLHTPGLVEAGIDDVSVEVFVSSASAVESGAILPARTALAQNVPNPFNPKTTIRFDLASPAQARLEIFDASGRLVRMLVDGPYPAGMHRVVWNGRDDAGRSVGSGIYYYRLMAGSFTQSRRMTILK